MIIGGHDACDGDVGAPMWVEENGKGIVQGKISNLMIIKNFLLYDVP